MDLALVPLATANLEDGENLRYAESAFAARLLARRYDGTAIRPSLQLQHLPLTATADHRPVTSRFHDRRRSATDAPCIMAELFSTLTAFYPTNEILYQL